MKELLERKEQEMELAEAAAMDKASRVGHTFMTQQSSIVNTVGKTSFVKQLTMNAEDDDQAAQRPS